MATGYFAAGVCWAVKSDAQLAAVGQSFPVISEWSGFPAYQHFACFPAPDDYCNLYTYRTDSGALVATYTGVRPATPSCELAGDPLQNTLDGITLGWLVVLSMALAYGFKLMKDQAK